MGRRKGSRDKNPEEANRKRIEGRQEWLNSEEGMRWKNTLRDWFKDPSINPNKDKIISTEEKKKNKAKYQKKWRKLYMKTEKGIMNHRKSEHKRRKRGFHPISLPLKVLFDWHHVNENDVVAIPKDIHNAIKHKCGDGKLEGVLG